MTRTLEEIREWAHFSVPLPQESPGSEDGEEQKSQKNWGDFPSRWNNWLHWVQPHHPTWWVESSKAGEDFVRATTQDPTLQLGRSVHSNIFHFLQCRRGINIAWKGTPLTGKTECPVWPLPKSKENWKFKYNRMLMTEVRGSLFSRGHLEAEDGWGPRTRPPSLQRQSYHQEHSQKRRSKGKILQKLSLFSEGTKKTLKMTEFIVNCQDGVFHICGLGHES